MVCDRCAHADADGRRFCPEHAYPLIWQALEDDLEADYVAATPAVAEVQVDLYSLEWLGDEDHLDETIRECEVLWAETWERIAADLPRSLRERLRAEVVPEGKRCKLVAGVRLEGLRPLDFVLLRQRFLAALEDFLA